MQGRLQKIEGPLGLPEQASKRIVGMEDLWKKHFGNSIVNYILSSIQSISNRKRDPKAGFKLLGVP